MVCSLTVRSQKYNILCDCSQPVAYHWSVVEIFREISLVAQGPGKSGAAGRLQVHTPKAAIINNKAVNKIYGTLLVRSQDKILHWDLCAL